MRKILINGLNAKTGGGKSILNNYLKILSQKSFNDRYFVLTPNKSAYDKYNSNTITIIDINFIYKLNLLLPYTFNYKIKNLIKKNKIDIVFNLADIPIATNKQQLFLFDWSYAVYPNSIVWKKMDFGSFIKRKIKLHYFKRNLKYVSIMIAQTEAMKKRLESIYRLENISVIPNAVSLENMAEYDYKNFHLPKGVNFLYLSYYYPHKNFEIFIPLAKEIKKRELNFKIIITIEKNQHKKAKFFLTEIETLLLNDIIINVGPVEMKHVPSLYNQTDGILMPTLLESFSGTYVEAMYHERPILTSNIDFATDVCKNSAFYFDPLDEFSILKRMEEMVGEKDKRENKIESGKQVLQKLLTWNEAFEKYQSLI